MGRFDITKSSEPRQLVIEELESRTQFHMGDVDVAPLSVVTSEQFIASQPIVSGLESTTNALIDRPLFDDVVNPSFSETQNRIIYQYLREIDFDQPISAIKIFGNRAFILVEPKVTNGTMQYIYGVSLEDPQAPAALGRLGTMNKWALPGAGPAAPIDETHVLLWGGDYRQSYSVYDVSNWQAPKLISNYVLSVDMEHTYLQGSFASGEQWNNIGPARMEHFNVRYDVREYLKLEMLSFQIDIESDYSLTTKASGFTLTDTLLIRDSADDRFSVRDREGSVQVLQRQPDGKFVPVGSFEFDEDIAEIRLLEDRLYLITKGEGLVADDGEIFEISLADPAVPVFLGKLNLPGSIFFAPLDATHVLTVHNSNRSNLRISMAPVFLIYNIQDRTSPKLVAQKILDVDSSLPYLNVRNWSFAAREGEVSLTFGYGSAGYWDVVESATIKIHNDYSLTISTPGFKIIDVAISTLTPSSRLANESRKRENTIHWVRLQGERSAFGQPIRNLPVFSGELNLPKTGAIISLDETHVMTIDEYDILNFRFFSTPVFSIYDIQDRTAPKLIRQVVLDLDSNLYETYSYLGDWVFSKEEGQVRLTVGFGPALTLYYKYFTIQVQDDYTLKTDLPGFTFIDRFRVRDAEGQFSVRQIGNNVQVLQRQADGRMLPVGTFELNEKISESRVFGDRLFLITRENDNALPETFAVSLTDPKAPLVLGKLTIPGKARSIPIAANYVMTVSPGYGPQEPIFYIYDVQDWANPKLVRTQVLHVDPSLGPDEYQLHLNVAQAYAGRLIHSTGLTPYEMFTIDGGGLLGISAAVEIQDDYSLKVLSTGFRFIDASVLASTPGNRIKNLVGKSQAIGEVRTTLLPSIVSNPGTTSEDGESAILPLAAYLINVPAEESVEATKKKEALSLPLVVNVLEPANEVSVAADDDDSGV